MTEYGIFDDSGCLESGFYSEDEAEEAIQKRYPDEEALRIYEICPDHEDQARDTCESCMEDDDGDS